jgi:CRP-like cAMP-binding protein
MAPLGKRRYLAAADIFRDLTPDQLAEVDHMTAMTTCRRGRVFYSPGENVEVLFLLKQGRVNIYRLSADGHKLVTASLEPITLFGQMPFIGQGMPGSFAEAAEDCTLCVMSRSDLEHLFSTWPSVAVRVLEVLAARLEAAEQQLELFAFRGVSARVAAALLQLAGENGDEIRGVTHHELAEQVGTHRETVTRALDDLRQQGLIELGRARIRILNAAELRVLSRP